jgi:hypothetical protein
MRAGLVKVDDLKVVVTDSKSKGAARVDMSWQTRRRLARSSASICSSMLSRHLSFNQNRRKTELVDSTRLLLTIATQGWTPGGLTSSILCRRGRKRDLTKKQFGAGVRGGCRATGITALAIPRVGALQLRLRLALGVH